MKVPPVVLSIADYDPSSGAGVTADIKTAVAQGCYAVTCTTALTVQSSRGVFGVQSLDPDLVRRTLLALAGDLDIAAVRVGVLGSAAVASVVASTLSKIKLRNIVVDPVVRSSSGAGQGPAGGGADGQGICPESGRVGVSAGPGDWPHQPHGVGWRAVLQAAEKAESSWAEEVAEKLDWMRFSGRAGLQARV